MNGTQRGTQQAGARRSSNNPTIMQTREERSSAPTLVTERLTCSPIRPYRERCTSRGTRRRIITPRIHPARRRQFSLRSRARLLAEARFRDRSAENRAENRAARRGGTRRGTVRRSEVELPLRPTRAATQHRLKWAPAAGRGRRECGPVEWGWGARCASDEERARFESEKEQWSVSGDHPSAARSWKRERTTPKSE